MIYNINPTIFSSTYAIPTDVADKYIKTATHTQLKVLLYFMRNLSDGIDTQKISDALSIAASEVEDALVFWQQRGVLIGEAKKEEEGKKVVINSSLPSRADVIKRGLEDKQLMFLLREAQLKFGRNLKQNESQLLVSLYDDYGMEPSVILFLLGFASREGKCNLSFVKKTATEWLSCGVETVMDAERIVAERVKQNLAWALVRNAFGIENRKPSTKELEYSNLWINEWKLKEDLLKAAYDICVDSKTKFSMAYVAKILDNWHKEGIVSPLDITNKEKNATTQAKFKNRNNDFGGYDLDKYEQMLNDKLKGRE